MTVRNLGLVVIVCLGLATMITLYLKEGRQETNQQGQPAVEKLYEVHYYPNRTVIRVEVVGSPREALVEIEKKYNIEDIIDRAPFLADPIRNLTIIAVPKDPNSPLP